MTSIPITPVQVADLLADGERMPVYVHVIDHPEARALVDTGLTELHPLVADMDPRLRPWSEQDVDLAGVFGELLDLRRVAEVGGNDPDLPGCGAPAEQDRLRLRELVGGPGDQDQRGTGVRQPERDGPADTAARSRDQRGLTAEVSYHHGLLSYEKPEARVGAGRRKDSWVMASSMARWNVG